MHAITVGALSGFSRTRPVDATSGYWESIVVEGLVGESCARTESGIDSWPSVIGARTSCENSWALLLAEPTDVTQEFARCAGKLPGVVAIFSDTQGPLVRVWTVIRDLDWSVERDIYECELSFRDRYPAVRWEFEVRTGNPDEIRSSLPPAVRELA